MMVPPKRTFKIVFETNQGKIGQKNLNEKTFKNISNLLCSFNDM